MRISFSFWLLFIHLPSLRFEKKEKNRIPTTNAVIDRDAYIHSNFGSTVTGRSAKFKALPIADVKRKSDMTTDFIDDGACVKAYSRPVMEAKISEIAMKK